MDMELFLTSISNFGFPIVVAGYLLLRTEKRLEALENTILGLKNSIDTLNGELIRKRK